MHELRTQHCQCSKHPWHILASECHITNDAVTLPWLTLCLVSTFGTAVGTSFLLDDWCRGLGSVHDRAISALLRSRSGDVTLAGRSRGFLALRRWPGVQGHSRRSFFRHAHHNFD